MRKITKVFTKTSIFASLVTVVNGNIVTEKLPCVDTFETVTDSNAVKIFKELSHGVYDKSNIVIRGFKRIDTKYTITAENFMKYSEDTEKVRKDDEN